jgi:hypothetical protein
MPFTYEVTMNLPDREIVKLRTSLSKNMVYVKQNSYSDACCFSNLPNPDSLVGTAGDNVVRIFHEIGLVDVGLMTNKHPCGDWPVCLPKPNCLISPRAQKEISTVTEIHRPYCVVMPFVLGQ